MPVATKSRTEHIVYQASLKSYNCVSNSDAKNSGGNIQPINISIERDDTQFRSNRLLRLCVLAGGDSLAVLLAATLGLFGAVAVRQVLGLSAPELLLTFPAILSIVILPIITMQALSAMWGHYIKIKPYWTEARELVNMALYAGTVAVIADFVVKGNASRIQMVLTLVMLVLLAPAMRFFAKRILIKSGKWFVPLIVVGDSAHIKDSEQAIESDKTLGYQVAARVVFHGEFEINNEIREDAASVILQLGASYHRPRLLLAFERNQLLNSQQSLVDKVANAFEQVIVGRPMQGLPAANAEVLAIDKYDTLFMRLSPGGIGTAGRWAKRSIDVIGSLVGMIILSPVMLFIAIRLRLEDNTVFYASERIGRDGRNFKCMKFRTMRIDAEKRLQELLVEDPLAAEEWNNTFKLKLDPRITALGAFLRRTSLDELPQLWNVLRGDMSLVGPRPILPDESDSYGPDALMTYQSVRPGLTGLWQVSGRNDLPYDQRIALNQWYVRNWSLWLDVSILLRTLPVLAGKDEAY